MTSVLGIRVYKSQVCDRLYSAPPILHWSIKHPFDISLQNRLHIFSFPFWKRHCTVPSSSDVRHSIRIRRIPSFKGTNVKPVLDADVVVVVVGGGKMDMDSRNKVRLVGERGARGFHI